MEHIIIYGSQYGSSRRYAEKLSEQTGHPPRSATKTPQTFQAEAWSSIWAAFTPAGVLGLSKTLRGFSLQDGQKLILVTVGLADPCEQENLDNIRASLRKQLSEKLVDRAKVFPSTRQD